jgi:hypothetical protein
LQSLGEVQPEVESAFSLQKARELPPIWRPEGNCQL